MLSGRGRGFRTLDPPMTDSGFGKERTVMTGTCPKSGDQSPLLMPSDPAAEPKRELGVRHAVRPRGSFVATREEIPANRHGPGGIRTHFSGIKSPARQAETNCGQLKRAANWADRPCNELQPDAACGDKPVRPLFTHCVGLVDNSPRQLARSKPSTRIGGETVASPIAASNTRSTGPSLWRVPTRRAQDWFVRALSAPAGGSGAYCAPDSGDDRAQQQHPKHEDRNRAEPIRKTEDLVDPVRRPASLTIPPPVEHERTAQRCHRREHNDRSQPAHPVHR